MSDSDEILLPLSAQSMDKHCADLAAQTPGPGQALAVMVALQSLVAAAVAPAQRFSPAYHAVQAVIGEHAAAARARLLQETSAALAEAIVAQNRPEIMRVHGALSRRGFQEAARRAIQALPPEAIQAAAAWADAWCKDAVARAQAASGYPDALDFRGAGISPAEYAAMLELNSYLAGAPQSAP